MSYTTEELAQRALLTERIAENLRTIEQIESRLDLDLDELAEQTSAIAGNLKIIEDDNSNLEELLEQTGEIVGNLRAIEQTADC